MGSPASPTRLAAILPLALWFAGVACASQSPVRVLLVFEDEGTCPACVEFETGLLRTLRAQLGPRLEFYREQIDAARFPKDRTRTIAAIQSRYANRNIKAVIYVGDVPAEIIPGTPTVHVGNSPVERSSLGVYHGSAGAVWFEDDLRKTVSIAEKLQPNARHVLVISGAAPSDLAWLDQFRSQLKSLEQTLSFEYVGDASVEQLLDRVAHLPRDTIVLPIKYSRDPAGNNYVPFDALARLAQASTAPVYAISDTYIGAGTVGGCVIDFTKAGAAAAEVTLKLMAGGSQPEISVEPEYVFDWRQLRRWGFSERDLPPGSVVEFRVPTAWEQYRWSIVGIGVILTAQALLIAALFVQMHRRKKAEVSVREMAGRLLQSQDDERRRMARDLHDGTAQHLSGIALSVGQVLADFPPGHDRLRQLLQESHVASRQALNEVRAVSYALHPPILDALGLIPALQWYLDGLQKRTSFSIDFDAPTDLADPNPDAKSTLFRIVQESVTNVLRHSGGTAMKVKLADGGRRITLRIEDNGRGMSTEELERAEGAASLGVGIAGMRERVRQLHGTFRIGSSSRGTQVFVSLPTQEEHYAAHPAG